jgi:Tol biopolymer transport system component
VFVSDRDGNNELYKMNADGTGETRLTHNAAYDGDPGWSPDGTQIVFTSERDGNFNVFKMSASGDANGTIAPTRLTTDAGHDGFPAWSPDGAKIAFVSDRTSNFEVYTMNADGTSQTNRTNNAENDYGPSWSPGRDPDRFRARHDGHLQDERRRQLAAEPHWLFRPVACLVARRFIDCRCGRGSLLRNSEDQLWCVQRRHRPGGHAALG